MGLSVCDGCEYLQEMFKERREDFAQLIQENVDSAINRIDALEKAGEDLFHLCPEDYEDEREAKSRWRELYDPDPRREDPILALLNRKVDEGILGVMDLSTLTIECGCEECQAIREGKRPKEEPQEERCIHCNNMTEVDARGLCKDCSGEMDEAWRSAQEGEGK